jgi:hypothetical protein
MWVTYNSGVSFNGLTPFSNILTNNQASNLSYSGGNFALLSRMQFVGACPALLLSSFSAPRVEPETTLHANELPLTMWHRVAI